MKPDDWSTVPPRASRHDFSSLADLKPATDLAASEDRAFREMLEEQEPELAARVLRKDPGAR